jgi:hypothetical protein
VKQTIEDPASWYLILSLSLMDCSHVLESSLLVLQSNSRNFSDLFRFAHEDVQYDSFIWFRRAKGRGSQGGCQDRVR